MLMVMEKCKKHKVYQKLLCFYDKKKKSVGRLPNCPKCAKEDSKRFLFYETWEDLVKKHPITYIKKCPKRLKCLNR